MCSIRQWLHALLESKRKGKGEEEYDEDEGMEGEAQEEEPDGAGWTTDEDEEDWAKRFLEEHTGGPPAMRLMMKMRGPATTISITICEEASQDPR